MENKEDIGQNEIKVGIINLQGRMWPSEMEFK